MPTNDTPPKAQTVPELVDDLQEWFSVWHRERTQWHSNITDLAIQQHYAEIGRKLDTRFPAIADYLLSQEAELTRLRGENDRYRTALERLARLGNGQHLGNSDGNVIAQKALSPSPLATP